MIPSSDEVRRHRLLHRNRGQQDPEHNLRNNQTGGIRRFDNLSECLGKDQIVERPNP